jgi:hypothetical protein|nr:MAG TPA: hypothetical protein [Crassvirales sp.]
MTLEELSNEFDVIVNSYDNSQSLVFNEYEKSIYLTKAQEYIIKDLYRNYEGTEELNSYLKTLIKDKTYTIEDSTNIELDYPDNFLYTLKEYANINTTCKSNNIVDVLPITQDEYNEVVENPFRGSKSKVLKLEENKIKLITDLPIVSYTMTYLSNPSPIILIDLPNGLTINNESKKSTTIETSESIHREILDKAVQLAIQSKTLLKSST